MTRRIAFIAGAVVLALILAIFAYNMWQASRTAKTERNVATGQTGAALNSAHDAIETIGNRAASETVAAKSVQETKDAINNASDVAGVTDAGRAGLCQQTGRRC